MEENIKRELVGKPPTRFEKKERMGEREDAMNRTKTIGTRRLFRGQPMCRESIREQESIRDFG